MHKGPWRRAHAHITLPILFILSSICGSLARTSLTRLTSYKGSPNGGVVWANFTGCFIMGLMNSTDLQLFANIISSHRTIATPNKYFDSKGAIPLFIAITTGFCGSLTSFSSFISAIFLSSANLNPVDVGALGQPNINNPPNPAYGIMTGLSVLLTQLLIGLAGFSGGEQLSTLIYGDKSDLNPGRISTFLRFSPNGYYITERFLSVVSICLYIVMIVLSATVPKSRFWTLQSVFAPLGTFSRFYFSKKFNNRYTKYPFMGTFLANILATILLSVLLLLQRGKSSNAAISPSLVQHVVSCQVLDALINGFCGCFSTISTFFLEIHKLFRKQTRKSLVAGYCYGLGTIILGYVLMVIILGSFAWSRNGLNRPSCYMPGSATR
ncbi:hypothetical protein NADFUDRAFT_22690 [Nadsonia fulvescens var. elongata DSM 6958]|uniref:CRCB-domain-containing protein n=1 Tax=Nadsonia fulvescens var. elongata DSM 6958 TaxID=857566 RepID=A0A1E3PLQ0_9ASCO|nr:hypothetical protein NADFUDRAFT_22690 [Nadsonia fulvescens var. elongata DSM 6958]